MLNLMVFIISRKPTLKFMSSGDILGKSHIGEMYTKISQDVEGVRSYEKFDNSFESSVHQELECYFHFR